MRIRLLRLGRCRQHLLPSFMYQHFTNCVTQTPVRHSDSERNLEYGIISPPAYSVGTVRTSRLIDASGSSGHFLLSLNRGFKGPKINRSLFQNSEFEVVSTTHLSTNSGFEDATGQQTFWNTIHVTEGGDLFSSNKEKRWISLVRWLSFSGRTFASSIATESF